MCLLASLSIIGLTTLSGCKQLSLLNPKGMVAQDEKDLLIIAVCLMLIIIIPVIVLTLLIAYRYRAGNKKAKYDPHLTHNNNLEIFWWAIPIVIILILAVVTWVTTHRLDPYRPITAAGKQPVTIEAVSMNWRWLFIYPDLHIATINEVKFPVNTPVNFYVTSDGPMNSLMIQQIAGQIYAMDGMTTQIHMISSHLGTYQGMSISFSGPGFSNMRFKAHVVDSQAFKAWISQVKKTGKILNWDGYQEISKNSMDTKVYYFKLNDSDLFHQIINKYMSPDMISNSATNAQSGASESLISLQKKKPAPIELDQNGNKIH